MRDFDEDLGELDALMLPEFCGLLWGNFTADEAPGEFQAKVVVIEPGSCDTYVGRAPTRDKARALLALPLRELGAWPPPPLGD